MSGEKLLRVVPIPILFVNFHFVHEILNISIVIFSEYVKEFILECKMFDNLWQKCHLSG